jgi:3D-(3,5/4)-trihydroxycyclohexane-1,2-dione acylhydrolase (decyclizing)
MGTDYRYRQGDSYSGGTLPVDFVANAASLGAHAVRAKTGSELRTALVDARKRSETTVVVVETAIDERVPGYESWWDVPIAEVAKSPAVREARSKYEKARQGEKILS